MASRRFTVDPVKKKEFINIFLLMPETRVDDAMRKAEFTEKDIADLLLRRSLQRALPGGSITGLQDYSGGGLSSYKCIAQLASSTAFIIGPPLDAGGTT